MKTRALLSIAAVAMMVGAFAQKPSITLTFTADSNGQHVPLHSILIENLTQGGDTTLNAPDTVLVLDYVAGIGETEINRNDVFVVSQNYPNPMQGKTTVNLYLPENDDVLISVSDIMGRELIRQELRLNQGPHSFVFFPERESLYFLTAWVNHQSQTIKMINNPSRTYGSGTCSLEYSGEAKGTGAYKSEMFLNNFAFSLGDQLKFTTSTALGDKFIIASPSGNQAYIFQFGVGGFPCPGMPTVTDIDDNVYKTVLIGSQCWMKENLKTTSYKNSTPIPNVIDASEWLNLVSGAYVWYDNDTSWKDKYGALYNWFTTMDPSGLCPTGWHVPSNAEWTQLVDYVVAQGFPNEWNNPSGTANALKSCRQVNSPLGADCNTTENPRWDAQSTHHGFDQFGFSVLPGSYRSSNGLFDYIGSAGYWWSSNEVSSCSAWHHYQINHFGNVFDIVENKNYGFSVRCLKDEVRTGVE
jgi:uncharacterized protein (TIGR02145 family)